MGIRVPLPPPPKPNSRMLLDNILEQQAAMRAMGKRATKLRCDAATLDVLLDELKPYLTIIPFPANVNSPARIYGLEVEISNEPDFDVV